MKKTILLLSLLMVGCITFGQVHFGPRIGYNSSKLSLDKDEVSADAKKSFNFGAFVRIGTKYYIQPEINYMVRGGELNHTNHSIDLDMKTIEIPVLIGTKIVGFGVGNVRAMAGPSATFVLDKKVDVKNSATGGIAPESALTKDNLEDQIWGMNVGLGVDVLMMTLDVRYQFGLSNVIKDTGLKSKDNCFVVSLGWKIL